MTSVLPSTHVPGHFHLYVGERHVATLRRANAQEGGDGWVSSRSELQPGAYGVAAPLPSGDVEGSVGGVALTRDSGKRPPVFRDTAHAVRVWEKTFGKVSAG